MTNSFSLKKYKIQNLLLKNYNNNKLKELRLYSDISFYRLIAMRLHNRNTKKKKNIIHAIFKSLILMFFRSLNYSKNFVFNKNIGRFVHKANFNIIKNKIVVAKFKTFKKEKIIFKKNTKLSTPLNIFFFFILSWVLFRTRYKTIENFNKNRVYIFSKTLYTIMCGLSITIYN